MIERRYQIGHEPPERWHEEDGTFWLWAWPELLGWSEPIEWILAPGNDNPFVGDLWGVTESGRLIAVEAKSSRSRDDPFADFARKSARLPPPVDRIREEWERYLSAERRFASTHGASLRPGFRADRVHRGVVPYSSRRAATGRWPTLYRNLIMPRFAGEYEARVLRFLDTAAVSPAIAFIGLITVVPGAPLRRPAIVYPTAARLVERAGADNVRLRAVSAHRDEAGVMVFSGWNVDVEVGEGPTVANAG